MTEVFLKRHVVLDKPEYLFELDEYRGEQGQPILLVHLRVFDWSPHVFKTIIREWRVFRQCVTAPIFATAEVDDTKWEKFVSHLGFKFLRNVDCVNGDVRRLFIHAAQPPAAKNFDHACQAPADKTPLPPKVRTVRRKRRRGRRRPAL